jgi:4-hydroxy 2-oxovalerate aldolase
MAKLLDTTIRDGSYVVNFQFTPKDLAVIASGLDKAGVPFIEIGHGLGMNAGTRPNMESPYTDEDYLKAASLAIKDNDWGMFFIPGIGRLEDIDLAAKYGMDFIRIGTNVTEVHLAEEYIKRAKEHGMYVAANFMKTYALEADEVGKQGEIAADFGADIVCIVDSAGGMFPEDVEAYFNAIRKYTNVDIGFHGHNNLGMAIANSLKAIELGCAVVDTSIRGMGRSSGNTVTEIFLLALKRKGIDWGINVTQILDIAENVIDPLLKNYQQVNSIGIISGYAQFHSSFLGSVLEYAAKYRVDPRELIVRVSEVDKINAPKELVQNLAEELSNEHSEDVIATKIQIPINNVAEQNEGMAEQSKIVAAQIASMTKKTGHPSVLNIVQSFRAVEEGTVSTVVHEGNRFIIGSAEVVNAAEAEEVVKAIDGTVEYILLDLDDKRETSSEIIDAVTKNAQQSKLLLYSDLTVWSESISKLIQEFNVAEKGSKVVLIGDNKLSTCCRQKLELVGIPILKYDEALASSEENLIVVLCEQSEGIVKVLCHKTKIVIDGLVGSLSEEEIESFYNKGVRIYRPEMQNLIHAEVTVARTISRLVNERQGSGQIDDVEVVAGGLIAPKGTVVIDSMSNPRKSYGVARGDGFLINKKDLSAEEVENWNKVEAAIAESLI